MKSNAVTVRVRLEESMFRKFALFDTFVLGKRWKLPTYFALILVGFSLVCLFSGKDESWLVGGLLMLIGLGMPAVYVFTFLYQVKQKARLFGLKTPKAMYTVTLTGNNVNIHNDYKSEPEVTLSWDKLFGAVRVKDAIYLYAVRARAFILPDGQADAEPDEVWALIGRMLPPEKRSDKRRKRMK